MKTTETVVRMIILQAADGMVLCDGKTCTSIGGTVVAPASADVTGWIEMTPEDAEKLLAAANVEEEVVDV